MRLLSPIALGITLAATVATAGAQTVISRQVSEELVETIVTQDPNGTVVTRRILPAQSWQAPLAPVFAPPVAYDPAPVYAPPLAAPPPVRPVVALEPERVDVVTTRPYVRPAAPAVVTRRVVVRPNAPIVARTDIRPARRVHRAVVLTPAEERVVYRTIIEQQVFPAAPVVRDAYWGRAPIVARTDVAPVPVVYSVGAALPAAVPLYGVPEAVAVRVPTTRPFSYAYVGGRVFLVDPVTSVIVADVTQY